MRPGLASASACSTRKRAGCRSRPRLRSTDRRRGPAGRALVRSIANHARALRIDRAGCGRRRSGARARKNPDAPAPTISASIFEHALARARAADTRLTCAVYLTRTVTSGRADSPSSRVTRTSPRPRLRGEDGSSCRRERGRPCCIFPANPPRSASSVLMAAPGRSRRREGEGPTDAMHRAVSARSCVSPVGR